MPLLNTHQKFEVVLFPSYIGSSSLTGAAALPFRMSQEDAVKKMNLYANFTRMSSWALVLVCRP